MGASEHLGTYAEGWTKGDADIILGAVTEDFVFDDPNSGQIPKSEFKSYMEDLKGTVDSLRGGQPAEQFMELTEVVTQESEGVITAWCWWAIPGTEIQGSGLLKVSSEGVMSERITYYTKL